MRERETATNPTKLLIVVAWIPFHWEAVVACDRLPRNLLCHNRHTRTNTHILHLVGRGEQAAEPSLVAISGCKVIN